jgi:hypothetical protein
MSIVGCVSAPPDASTITSLLRTTLGIDEHALAVNSKFQQWKYWEPHPLNLGSRSHTLKNEESIVAHACAWPIQLSLPMGSLKAFHLVDWAAAPGNPGAGVQVLRQCCSEMAAAFCIGGSEMTKKILPAFGFRLYNHMTFMRRPLRPVRTALRESPLDWKMPARVVRNVQWYYSPSLALPQEWRVTPVDPEQIPEALMSASSEDIAVSQRSPQLLSHIMSCPALQRSACALVSRGSGAPAAYFLLVQVGDQVRLADYGPASLDEETSRIVGLGAQVLARSLFPDAMSIIAATSETSSRSGFLQSGFRLLRDEPIKVLKLNKALGSISQFRLTLIDGDALCL